jgi:hypothetical protein
MCSRSRGRTMTGFYTRQRTDREDGDGLQRCVENGLGMNAVSLQGIGPADVT